MNEQNPVLPELSDDVVARIERDVFDRIADEPDRNIAAGARPKRRRWLVAGGIAAAFVIGVLVTPPILNGVNQPAMVADGGSVAFTSDSAGSAVDMGVPESATMSGEGEPLSADMATEDAATTDREIIASAYATVEVAGVPEAVSVIGDIAEAHDGYVESTSVSRNTAYDASLPAPPTDGYGWVSIRVPSDQLTDVITELDDAGTVQSSSVTKQDVTSTAIDLRARVEALEASVARLTELMAQSGSVSELIEAEVALTDRQAELESYQQQLTALEDQVAMSSLQIELVPEPTTETADPAGFNDGLLAGWNGLIVSLNALVITFGFLLPWLVIAGIVFLVVWGIRRARKRHKA